MASDEPVHNGLVSPSVGTRTLNWVCGTAAAVLLACGFVAALVTGFIAFVLTSEGIPFWSQLAWFVTLMCLMGPLLFLYAYDVWQKKKGLG